MRVHAISATLENILKDSSTNAIRANKILTNGGKYVDHKAFSSITSQELDDTIDEIHKSLSSKTSTHLLTAQDETALIKALWVLEDFSIKQGDLNHLGVSQKAQKPAQFLETIKEELYSTSRNMAEQYIHIRNVLGATVHDSREWAEKNPAVNIRFSEYLSLYVLEDTTMIVTCTTNKGYWYKLV